MNDLWLFVEHGNNKTWTRADVPHGVATVRDLIGYLQHGGRVDSPWMVLPDRPRFTPRAVGMTIIATLHETESK
jgi:hypothetical protein